MALAARSCVVVGARLGWQLGAAVGVVPLFVACAGGPADHGAMTPHPGLGQRGDEAGSPTKPIRGAAVIAMPGAPDAAASALTEGLDCSENLREIRHHVDFATKGADSAVLTVVRDFEPRAPQAPVCLSRRIRSGADSVITSFSAETDGIQRTGALGAQRLYADPPPDPQAGPENRPWVSLEWSAEGAELYSPEFITGHGVQVRYAIQARAQRDGRLRRWEYCDGSAEGTDDASAEMLLSEHDQGLAIRHDEDTGCLYVEASAPPPPRLSARYGVYRLGGGAWWWRVEMAAPEKLPLDPQPPAPGPVVFVMDASRSARRDRELVTQLAIVEAYLKNAPAAEVELVLTNRTAERVFGRFVSAAEVSAAAVGLENAELKNGSFLDRGAELAVHVVAESGRPGRILLFTDGEMRSRFNPRAVLTALNRAPRGTTVHVIYPYSSARWPTRPSVDRVAVTGDDSLGSAIDNLSTAFGGGAYSVAVDSREPKSAALELAVAELVRPARFDSIGLREPNGDEWPPEREEYTFGWNIDDEPRDTTLEPGNTMVWRGTSTRKPPDRLTLMAWVWGQKHEMAMRRDPVLESSMPSLVVGEAWCSLAAAASWNEGLGKKDDPWRLLLDRARRDGFLAPGLAFWVAGSGDTDVGLSGDDWQDCTAGFGRGSSRPQKKADLVPRVRTALEACGLESTANGPLLAKVEVQRNEVLDVSVDGHGDAHRRCAEEAIWATFLPDDFNEGIGERLQYSFRLSPTPTH